VIRRYWSGVTLHRYWSRVESLFVNFIKRDDISEWECSIIKPISLIQPHMREFFDLRNDVFEIWKQLTLYLDGIHARIQSCERLIDRVRIKILWLEERDKYVKRMQKIIADILMIINKRYVEQLRNELCTLTLHRIDEGHVCESSSSCSNSPDYNERQRAEYFIE
jgi:hypothetical protein